MKFEESQAQLEISFDGAALADGRMNVRDLAPSMLGVGELFESANRVLNGTRASVNINVRATSSSSFHIIYEVIQSQSAMGIPFQELIATASNIYTLLFGGPGIAVALFFLIKWLHGRRPKVEKINDDLFKLTIDGETYEVPLALLRLYQDTIIHRALANIVRPVKEQGIDVCEIRDNNRKLLQSVTKQEVDGFDVPEFQEPLLNETHRCAFSIVSLAFKEDNKWRLTDGQVIYSVLMNDAEFQRKVDNNEAVFAKGDVLICDLHTVQWQVQGGVKTDYEVTKVHDHKHARQLPMFDLLDSNE